MLFKQMGKTATIIEKAIGLIEIYFIKKNRKITHKKNNQPVKLSIPQATHRKAIILEVAVTVYIANIVVQVTAPNGNDIDL